MTHDLQKPTPGSAGETGGHRVGTVGTVNRLIVIVLFEGVDLLDVTGPPEVFSS